MAKHGEISSHFFRIILPHTLENGTLELPRNFVKEHGKRLHKYARLKLPTGAESKMEVKRCNNRAWLQQGWQDFVEKYSIQCGYFLVFRYKGGSRFSVRIYDLSTSEIEYPLSNATTSDKKAGKCKLVEVKDENAANQSRNRVVQRAKAFQSPNLHFIVIMTPAYVSDTGYLHVPVGPARSYFLKKGDNSIHLNLNGRTWPMKYYIGAPPQCAVRFKWGWSKFSQENHLQEGDICAFELVNSEAMLFNVTLFRNKIIYKKASPRGTEISATWKALANIKSLACHPSGMKEAPNQIQMRKRKRGASPEESRAVERAKAFKCSDSSFTVMMRKSYVEDWYRLVIPVAHGSRFLMDQHGKEAFLHRLDEETWPVSIYVHGKEARFSSGWKDFVVDNNLQQGDACVFELFRQVPNHYKVTIFRVAESP